MEAAQESTGESGHVWSVPVASRWTRAWNVDVDVVADAVDEEMELAESSGGLQRARAVPALAKAGGPGQENWNPWLVSACPCAASFGGPGWCQPGARACLQPVIGVWESGEWRHSPG